MLADVEYHAQTFGLADVLVDLGLPVNTGAQVSVILEGDLLGVEPQQIAVDGLEIRVGVADKEILLPRFQLGIGRAAAFLVACG